MRATAESPPIGRDDRPDTGPAAQQTIVRSVATAGKPVTTAARSVFDMVPKTPSKRGGRRVELPPLDMSNLQPQAGVPVPVKQRTYRALQTKYEPVFTALQVGTSLPLPVAYLGTILTASKKRQKAGLGKYTCRRISETEMRIWRDE